MHNVFPGVYTEAVGVLQGDFNWSHKWVILSTFILPFGLTAHQMLLETDPVGHSSFQERLHLGNIHNYYVKLKAENIFSEVNQSTEHLSSNCVPCIYNFKKRWPSST